MEYVFYLDWADRSTRHLLVIHAEVNALRWADPSQTRGGMLCCTHHPCVDCLKQVSAYGIRDVWWSTRPGGRNNLDELAVTADTLRVRLHHKEEV